MYLDIKSDKEKTAILNTPVIKDKLKKELLKEAAMGNAYYNFRDIINVLSLSVPIVIILIMMIYMKHLKSLVIRIFLIIIV